MNPTRPFFGEDAPRAPFVDGLTPRDMAAKERAAFLAGGAGVGAIGRDERLADKRRPLELACDEQDAQKSHLNEVIRQIESRVAAVQRPPRDERPGAIEAVPQRPTIGTSPIVRHVEDTSMFIEGCTRRLAAVLDSLEI